VDILENFTFDELSIGQTASYSKTIGERDLILFAAVSGDVNPVHLDPEFAANTMFKERIAHGMWTGAIVSAALALTLPGPGAIYLSQNLSFRAPVKIGDTVTVKLTVTEKREDKKYVTLACDVVNQTGKTVATGTAQVIAPAQKMRIPAPKLPTITIGS
jgi:3-hydroxybutyryl-CoA dehydratase